MNYLLLIIGFVLLSFAADWLVEGASGLAKRLHVSDLIIGLTIVAFGTSAPELIVNIIASKNGTNEIALTNILGSNTINTLVVLGLSAIIYPVACKKNTFRYEIPLSIAAGVAVLLLGTNFFGWQGKHFDGISRFDGILLLIVFVCFIGYTVNQALLKKAAPEESFTPIKIWKAVLLILLGLIGLVVGGELIVKNAIVIAKCWGVSESVIGATIVALGTSLPELATSAVAAMKKNTDLAIGNVIGSNIFNVFFVLGISATIRPLNGYANLIVDSSLAALSSLLILIFIFLSKKRRINRIEGIIMLIIYALYLWWLLT